MKTFAVLAVIGVVVGVTMTASVIVAVLQPISLGLHLAANLAKARSL